MIMWGGYRWEKGIEVRDWEGKKYKEELGYSGVDRGKGCGIVERGWVNVG